MNLLFTGPPGSPLMRRGYSWGIAFAHRLHCHIQLAGRGESIHDSLLTTCGPSDPIRSFKNGRNMTPGAALLPLCACSFLSNSGSSCESKLGQRPKARLLPRPGPQGPQLAPPPQLTIHAAQSESESVSPRRCPGPLALAADGCDCNDHTAPVIDL